jgi:hypothetical protein
MPLAPVAASLMTASSFNGVFEQPHADGFEDDSAWSVTISHKSMHLMSGLTQLVRNGGALNFCGKSN